MVLLKKMLILSYFLKEKNNLLAVQIYVDDNIGATNEDVSKNHYIGPHRRADGCTVKDSHKITDSGEESKNDSHKRIDSGKRVSKVSHRKNDDGEDSEE